MQAGKFIIGGLAALCIALSGCNSGDGLTVVAAADLLGKWNFTQGKYQNKNKITVNGKVMLDTVENETEDLTGDGYYVEFKDSAKFAANIPNSGGPLPEKASAAASIPISGTWAVEGNTLTLISSFGTFKDTLLAQVAVSGASATFTLIDEGKMSEGTYITEWSNLDEYTATKQ